MLLFVLAPVFGNDIVELPKESAEFPLTVNKITLDGKQGFQIASGHYSLACRNEEQGLVCCQRMEHFYAAWHAFFHDLLPPEKAENIEHKIMLYAGKKDYAEHLRFIDPMISRSNGFYFPPKKTAYFYPAEEKVWFHEGTHQLFAELLLREKTPAFANNFWIIEGAALFMETLTIEESKYTLGDKRDNRLYAAKVYRQERNYQLSIEALAAKSAADIQSSKDIAKIYGQSAALTHYLIFAEEGQYRKHFLELLRLTYQDKAKPETLSILTGLTFRELDQRYEQFLETVPE